MISNKKIIDYLQVTYNKKITDLNSNDILNLETIIFSNDEDINLEGEIEQLMAFPNIKKIIIEDSIITNKTLDTISHMDKLCELCFVNCYFLGDINFTNFFKIKYLKIEQCFLKNYDILLSFNSLEKLEIINPYKNKEINLKSIITDNINFLILENCDLKEVNYLQNKNKLAFLSLLNSTYYDKLDFIKDLPSLENIYLNDGNVYELNENQNIYDSYINLIEFEKNNSELIL